MTVTHYRYYDRRAYFSAGGQITNPRDGQTAGE